MRASHVACLAVASCLIVQGCGGTAFMLPPVSDREALLAAEEIDGESGLPQFPRSSAYYRETISRLDRQLTERVAAICVRAETAECRFAFHYVDNDEVNAFTDENGDIYLHRGLLDHLESDEEIAAVMAHEMSHQIAGSRRREHAQRPARRADRRPADGRRGGGAGADQDGADAMAGVGMDYGGRVGLLTFLQGAGARGRPARRLCAGARRHRPAARRPHVRGAGQAGRLSRVELAQHPPRRRRADRRLAQGRRRGRRRQRQAADDGRALAPLRQRLGEAQRIVLVAVPRIEGAGASVVGEHVEADQAKALRPRPILCRLASGAMRRLGPRPPRSPPAP